MTHLKVQATVNCHAERQGRIQSDQVRWVHVGYPRFFVDLYACMHVRPDKQLGKTAKNGSATRLLTQHELVQCLWRVSWPDGHAWSIAQLRHHHDPGKEVHGAKVSWLRRRNQEWYCPMFNRFRWEARMQFYIHLRPELMLDNPESIVV